MGWRVLSACSVLWLTILPVSLAAQEAISASEAIETKDRLSSERISELVAAPMSIVRRDGVRKGKSAFARLLAAASAEHGERSVEAADLLTAFGVSLYLFGSETDDRHLWQEALAYLEAAIPAYRGAFGGAHPEVAVALNTYADLELALHDHNPTPNAESALEEAYRIRMSALGPTNIETLATLRYLASLRGHPSRTRGERARVEEAAELFRQLIARSSNEAWLRHESAPYARLALARMYAQNGMAEEAREQIRLATDQVGDWPREDRCAFINMETVRVERILAGEDPEGDGLVEFERLASCLGLKSGNAFH